MAYESGVPDGYDYKAAEEEAARINAGGDAGKSLTEIKAELRATRSVRIERANAYLNESVNPPPAGTGL